MATFLFAYRVPTDYQPSGKTGKAWEVWFQSLGSNRIDIGHAVIATRMLGNLDAGTRLGGYSVVTAEDLEAAAALTAGCPAIQLGGGVEIGTIPEFTGRPQGGTDA